MTNDLEPYENITHVFWIKIELRENPRNGNRIHGEIRDAISGEKNSIEDLIDIIGFIVPYLQKMNIHINWFWRIMNWYKSKCKVRS